MKDSTKQQERNLGMESASEPKEEKDCGCGKNKKDTHQEKVDRQYLANYILNDDARTFTPVWKSVGFGDTISKWIKIVTFGKIKECAQCSSRRRILNQLFPYRWASLPGLPPDTSLRRLEDIKVKLKK